MTVITERADLLPFTHLAKGSHTDPAAGVCLLEAVAYVAGESHSDRPTCASPILGSFGRNLNDVLPDDKRQRLVPLVPLIVGTAGDGHDQARGLMAADWLARTYVPTWLRLAGLTADAAALEAAPEVSSWDELVAVTPLLVKGQESAADARDAAWAAAGAAAGAAAWDAAGAAARDAAWAAAGAAAGATAWAAAGDAARAAARDAAWAAAWDAAGDAARAAAGDAARAALQPTVDQLQDSAIDLYTRMVTIGSAA